MAKAFDCAVRLLARREHSAFELTGKLKAKGFDADLIDEALKTCQDLSLQSDQRFVENYCHSRMRQGYGPLRILQELKQKGVDTELISSILQQKDLDWLAHAMQVWQKKGKGQSEWSDADLQKQQRFLIYRGFDAKTIASVKEELE